MNRFVALGLVKARGEDVCRRNLAYCLGRRGKVGNMGAYLWKCIMVDAAASAAAGNTPTTHSLAQPGAIRDSGDGGRGGAERSKISPAEVPPPLSPAFAGMKPGTPEWDAFRAENKRRAQLAPVPGKG